MERRDFGSTRKLPSGQWQARWTENGTTHTGEQTFTTKRAAQQYLAQVRTRLSKGERVDPRSAKALVGELVTDFLATQRSRLKPKTYDSYDSLARTVIGVGEPYTAIAARKVGDVRPSDVARWLGGLDLSASRIRQAHRVLSLVLDAAVRDGRISSNPCTKAPLPRLPERLPNVLNPVEIERLRTAMDERFRAIVDVMAWGGLRLGEALALRRNAVDTSGRTITVSGSLSEAKDVEGHWRVEETTPKSHLQRTVHMTKQTAQRLQEHLDKFTEAEPDALLFPARQGGRVPCGPMRQSNFARNLWSPATKKAKLVGTTRHDLRTTCASLLIQQGASPIEVQEHLGHADVLTTMRIYARATRQTPERLMDRMAQIQTGQHEADKDISQPA